MSGHVESLLSAAYDGELSPDARAAFDRHLGECAACAAAFAALTTAVDALREQPPARMPQPVRLPPGSPVPEPRWFGVPAWVRLPEGRRWRGGLTAAGVVVAGVAAAVVVVGHLPGGGAANYSSASTAGGPLAAAPSGFAQIAGGASSSRAASGACPGGNCSLPVPGAPTIPGACASQGLGISAGSAAQIPGGFNNRDTQDEGGTSVVLAAPSFDYTPGATVDIYARLINDSTGAVSLPCPVLTGSDVSGSSAAPQVPSAATTATPAGTLTVGGQPVLQVVVPSAATAGQTYHIVVDVPASDRDPQAWQASLAIQIT